MTYISRTQRRQRYDRTHLLVSLGRFALGCITLTTVAFFLSLILINWISGCGERFPTMNGGYVQGECISPLDLFRDQPTSEEK